MHPDFGFNTVISDDIYDGHIQAIYIANNLFIFESGYFIAQGNVQLVV